MPLFEMTIEEGPWSGMYALWDGGNLTIDVPPGVRGDETSLRLAFDTIRARLVVVMGLQ
jgi:hypothetical protein